MDDTDYQKRLAFELLTRLKDVKEIELKLSRLCIDSFKDDMQPAQILLALRDIQRELRSLAISDRTFVSNQDDPTNLQKLLYERAHGQAGTIPQIHSWVRGIQSERIPTVKWGMLSKLVRVNKEET